MNIFRRVVHSRLNKIIQLQNSRAFTAVNCLKELGYPIDRIRRVMPKLEGIDIKALARDKKMPPATIYGALHGRRNNREAISVIADALKVPGTLIFPN